MYGYIKGYVKKIKENQLIIENQGIGYLIHTSSNTLRDSVLNHEATVYTHLYVREDMIQLYGFISEEALVLFEQLIKISGVGPKAALAILSLSDVPQIKQAIAQGNHVFISKASGIGKKTSERIIIELKDKLKADVLDTDLPQSDSVTSVYYDNVLEALVSLGFNPSEVQSILKRIDQTNLTEDEVIKLALKKLGK
jgi:Holliday junction DNA helicase RuvA